jgi:hypothetical protein
MNMHHPPMHAPVSVGGNRDSDNNDAENQHDHEGTCAHNEQAISLALNPS